ncbi:uncharacterized protein LOC122251570 [Penaeus japonicus]|uniref:uncharacterized protein LOC122251570 n=1 Tax=Penaeus japonicus TaxID=27405 RepID=UPI001C70E2DC|nr:uncharacterized protein LOC122251570 [Penaeus japonicus]
MGSVVYAPPLQYHLMPFFYNLRPPPPYAEERGAPEPEGDQLRLLVLANQLAVTQLNQVVTQLVKIGDEGRSQERTSMASDPNLLEFHRKLLQNVIEGFKALAKTLQDREAPRGRGEEDAMCDALQGTVEKMLQNITEDLASSTANISLFENTVDDMRKTHERRLFGLESQLSDLTTLVMQARNDLFNVSQLMQENFDNLTREEPPTPAPLLCPEDYHYLEGECFFVSEVGQALNWNQARKTCRLTDGDLAEPEEVLRLILLLKDSANDTADVFWLGGRKQQTASRDEGRTDAEEEDPTESLHAWHWLSGSPIRHGWLLGKPSFDPTKICLGASIQGLSNENCNTDRRFVCELNMGSVAKA